ncbi:MAG: hypothetical protein H6718_28825 [Polyangiaceae bacterium]|nr:hypothetical protein [Polyangiaceae bacterium]
MRGNAHKVVLTGLLALSCDPLIVEAARPFPPNAGPSYVPGKPASTRLEREADVCANRAEGTPCKGQEGVFSDYSICHEHVCIESRCGDGVVDRRKGEFCDAGDDAGACGPGCSRGCSADADCADPSACNGVERCIDGACANGERVTCDDADPETVDICLDDTGACLHDSAKGPFRF